MNKILVCSDRYQEIKLSTVKYMNKSNYIWRLPDIEAESLGGYFIDADVIVIVGGLTIKWIELINQYTHNPRIVSIDNVPDNDLELLENL